ncbi:MAG: hypothetical protein ACPGOV_15570 [Magnetovibrionaceae bacterium]
MPKSKVSQKILGRSRRLSLVSTVLAASLLAPNIASALCKTETERAAVQHRLLQTELMVAAFACGQRADYNTFASKHGSALAHQGKNLKAAFQAQAGGTKALNSFVTRLANQASRQHQTDPGAFCHRAHQAFDRLGSMSRQSRSLPITIDRAATYGVPACGIVQSAQADEPG